MQRRDYVILTVLIAVAILSVFVVNHIVEASWVALAAGDTGELDVNSAYPEPYPMYSMDGPNLLPLIFSSGN